MSGDIHPRNIHTEFEKNPNNWLLSYRRTDKPTDSATAICPVDILLVWLFGGGGAWVAHK